MRSKYIFYLHDNKIDYTKKDEINSYEFSLECMQYSKIINIEVFIKELKKFVKKRRISTIFSPAISVIIPFNYNNADKEILLMCFNSLGINKINFVNELELYPKKNNLIILNISETYLIETQIINNQAKNLFYPFNLFKDKKQLISIITSKNKLDSYLLFGPNEFIQNYIEILKEKNIKNLHYYNNYKYYIINQFQKKYNQTSKIN